MLSSRSKFAKLKIFYKTWDLDIELHIVEGQRSKVESCPPPPKNNFKIQTLKSKFASMLFFISLGFGFGIYEVGGTLDLRLSTLDIVAIM